MPMTFHRDRLSRPRIVAFCLLAMIFVTQANAATCRVSTQGSTSNNGATWAAPMSLQKALSTASCTEIWVAQGIYKPTTGTDRSISFNIRPNVQVYGGFAGNETTRNQRNPITRATTLSGDIGIPNDISDNSIRVVAMDGTTAAGIINNNTVLDGFTIRDGNAWDDTTSTNGSGGGLRCLGRWAGNECSPTLRQLIFVDNRASWGGALHNDGSRGGISSPTMSDVSFSNNIARFNGGAMLNSAGGLATEPTGTSSPVLNNVEFIGNHANWTGGAMVNDGGDNGVSSPRITNAAFIDNNADISAGAMANDAGRAGVSSPALSKVKFMNNIAAKWGGAVWNDAFGTDSTASATFQDVVFHGNGAEFGGAVYNRAQLSGTSKALFRGVTFSNNNAILGGAINNYGTEAGDSSPIFANVTFSGNSATSDGGAIYNQGGKSNSTVPGTSSPKLTNVTLHGNSASRGGAIYNLSHAGGTVKPRLINVILWGNTAPTNPQVHSNALAEINVSFSVVQGGCNSIPAAICAQTNLISSPRLRPLANNGGFTKTMLVTLGSSAVNTGYLDACVKPNVNGVDQRGVSRPQGSTNQCDIGAVEVIPSELQLLFRDGFEAD